MKKFILVFLLLISSQVFAQVRVGILNGPSCIPMAQMMENISSIQGEPLDFQKFSDAKSLVPKLLKDEIDIGFLPPNVAAKIYNSKPDSIICAGITGNGNISLITKDKKISSLKDLKGKTVYVAGQGATPEYITRFLLEKNNIPVTDTETSDSVCLSFSIPTAQLATQIITNRIEYAVVVEPFATIASINNESVISAIDFQAEFTKATGIKNYPITLMVVSKKFAQEHTEIMNLFIKEYEFSLNQTLGNPSVTGELCEKYQLGLNKNIVVNTIPKANFVFVSGKKGKAQIQQLLTIFLNSDSASIGGKLPDEDFYY